MNALWGTAIAVTMPLARTQLGAIIAPVNQVSMVMDSLAPITMNASVKMVALLASKILIV
jgi:hypothetical protein